ncbi:hypothetical protein CAEBREN_15365 [Caenorhabditis brenneri]|uniref:Uncharacterized protein n=1 Tax=Caenorhabditis brenneri TaxID=135651 RepID=G0P1S7_CAEBE|nr:hypothetical protein CAEBREN_15365 [Caenorhabditis brenneri]
MYRKLLLLTFALLFGCLSADQRLSSTSISSMNGFSAKRGCEQITIPMCKNLDYNQTVFPNLLGHTTQDEANPAISQFNPLIKVKCSEDIRLFLCTVYAPVCTVLDKPIQPCRELCLSAKNGCESLMKKFGFQWPEQLDCNKFPVTDLCVGKNSSDSSSSKKSSSDVTFGVSTIANEVVLSPKKCPHVMRTTTGSHFSLPLLSGRLPECSLTCEADNQVPMMFDARIRRYLRICTAAWAVACFVCSLFTMVTFLVDLSRFAYPVRPILYLAFCYLAVSLVYMIGVVGEDGFACGAYGSTPTILVTQGGENVGCSALAVVHYFFFMSSCAWWLVLCLAWFLAANLKWGAESIAALSPYFHALCWGFPAVLSVIVLVTNSIDGDVFTGICSVGNLNPSALVYFFFAPIVVSLVLGGVLLACGIWSMCRIRNYIKLQHADVERNISKLEKLMFRIGAFAVLYAVPNAMNAAIMWYQAVNMPAWLEGWLHFRCMRHQDRDVFGFTYPTDECPLDPKVASPEIIVFHLKYISQLVVGITCAIWVISSKTVSSYQKAYLALTSRTPPVPAHVDQVNMR